MTSIPPYRIQVPLLLGGPDAAALAPKINAYGFAAQVASDKLGVASAEATSLEVSCWTSCGWRPCCVRPGRALSRRSARSRPAGRVEVPGPPPDQAGVR